MKTPRLHIFSGTIAKYPELAEWLAGLPSRKKTGIVINILLAHIRREKKKEK